MTQEFWDLRKSILDGRYDNALVIVDELELMSRKSYIRNIRSFLIRLSNSQFELASLILR